MHRFSQTVPTVCTLVLFIISDHVKLTARYAEDYATQHIYVMCGVSTGLCNVWGVAREVKVQNNARKTDFLQKFAYRSRLPGWLDIILSFSVCLNSSFSV